MVIYEDTEKAVGHAKKVECAATAYVKDAASRAEAAKAVADLYAPKLINPDATTINKVAKFTYPIIYGVGGSLLLGATTGLVLATAPVSVPAIAIAGLTISGSVCAITALATVGGIGGALIGTQIKKTSESQSIAPSPFIEHAKKICCNEGTMEARC